MDPRQGSEIILMNVLDLTKPFLHVDVCKAPDKHMQNSYSTMFNAIELNIFSNQIPVTIIQHHTTWWQNGRTC